LRLITGIPGPWSEVPSLRSKRGRCSALAKTLVSQSNLRSTNVRESSALTTSYIFSDSFNVQGANQLQLLVSFTKGSSEGCRLKVEFSEDGENWYQESAVAMSDTGDTRDAIHRPALRKVESSSDIVVSIPLSASFFRISAAAITVGTGTSLSIMATIANI
jgi:hypothetical protein